MARTKPKEAEAPPPASSPPAQAPVATPTTTAPTRRRSYRRAGTSRKFMKRAQGNVGTVLSALGGAVAGSLVQQMAVDALDVKPLGAAVGATVVGGGGALVTEGNAQAFLAGVGASGAAHGFAAWQEARAKKKAKRKEEERKKRDEDDDDEEDDDGDKVADNDKDKKDGRKAELPPADDVMADKALEAARAEYEAARREMQRGADLSEPQPKATNGWGGVVM